MAVKRFDVGVHQTKAGRRDFHFCQKDPNCFGCKQGIPWEVQTDPACLALVSESTLLLALKHYASVIDGAVMTRQAILAELSSRCEDEGAT